jgi:hypothetical protein
VPALDIDRDAARAAAQQELDKPIYPKGSLLERLSEWLNDLLYRIAQASSTVPGGWVTVAVLVALLLVAVVVAARIASRTLRTRRGDTALFDDHELGADEHRATAEAHAAAGRWELAIRHRLRAVARHLEQIGVLQPAPGRTANELARDAGGVLPQLADGLRSAATAFNDVTFGGRPGTAAAYRMIADLDDQLRSSASKPAQTSGHGAGPGGWAEVR